MKWRFIYLNMEGFFPFKFRIEYLESLCVKHTATINIWVYYFIQSIFDLHTIAQRFAAELSQPVVTI